MSVNTSVPVREEEGLGIVSPSPICLWEPQSGGESEVISNMPLKSMSNINSMAAMPCTVLSSYHDSIRIIVVASPLP